MNHEEKNYTWFKYDVSTLEVWPDYSSIRDHQYWLLESALIPEKDLPQFLINNMKL